MIANSSNYSVVLTGETGVKNGFKMTNNASTGWKTASGGTGDFFQQAVDATFDLTVKAIRVRVTKFQILLLASK